MPVSHSGPNAADANAYKDYSQDHAYEHDTGLIVLPVGSREPKHRVIRLHGGVGIRRVKWSASRTGKPPIIPKAEDLAADTILSSSVSAALPTPLPQSGQYLFSLSGEYTYVQESPRVAGTNAFPTGVYPYTLNPHDAIASAAVGGLLAHRSAPTTVADFDAAVTIVDTAVRYGRGTHFSWPLTVIPASFSAPTLE